MRKSGTGNVRPRRRHPHRPGRLAAPPGGRLSRTAFPGGKRRGGSERRKRQSFARPRSPTAAAGLYPENHPGADRTARRLLRGRRFGGGIAAPAPMGRKGIAAGARNRRRPALRMARLHARRRAPLLHQGGGHVADGPAVLLQVQPPAPAPDRRPRVADRNQTLPAPDPARGMAHSEQTRQRLPAARGRRARSEIPPPGEKHTPRTGRNPLRRLLHAGRHPRDSRLRGTARHRGHSRNRPAGALAGGHRLLSAAGVRRPRRLGQTLFDTALHRPRQHDRILQKRADRAVRSLSVAIRPYRRRRSGAHAVGDVPGLPTAHPGREAGRRRRTAGMVHP